MDEPKKILLVNIEGTSLRGLPDILEMWDYTPIEMDSAPMIPEVFTPESPTLILFQFLEFSDHEYELLQSISRRVLGVPIIATSPFISVRDTFRIAKEGVTEYLVQPYFPADLKKLIEKYIGKPMALNQEHDKMIH